MPSRSLWFGELYCRNDHESEDHEQERKPRQQPVANLSRARVGYRCRSSAFMCIGRFHGSARRRLQPPSSSLCPSAPARGSSSSPRSGVSSSLSAALAYVVARAVFAPGRVTYHRITGAVLLYLTIGQIFVGLYGMVDLLAPHSLSGVNQYGFLLGGVALGAHSPSRSMRRATPLAFMRPGIASST
jgi:hypothetical protein